MGDKEFSDLGIDPKFFMKLSAEALLRVFFGFKFPSWELPQPTQARSGFSPCNEDLAVFLDDRRGNCYQKRTPYPGSRHPAIGMNCTNELDATHWEHFDVLRDAPRRSPHLSFEKLIYNSD